MPSAKDIILKPIQSALAIAFVKAHHYSGKVAQNSQLHLGVFLDNKLHGVMQFGPSLDKRKIQGLVRDTQWHEFLELNRMAFDDVLPRNSESRALAIAWRLLKKHAPQVKWVVSFADGTQCGDGTIYRAAGFVLTGITVNSTIYEFPSGERLADIAIKTSGLIQKRLFGRMLPGVMGLQQAMKIGARRVPGFQLRYIYFIDPTYRSRLTVPELPYSEIERRGAGMYLGKKREQSIHSDAATFPVADGGASPTCSLQLSEIPV